MIYEKIIYVWERNKKQKKEGKVLPEKKITKGN